MVEVLGLGLSAQVLLGALKVRGAQFDRTFLTNVILRT